MKAFLTFILCSWYLPGNAQRCTTASSGNIPALMSIETPVTANNGRDTVTDEVIVVPVVIHVLYHMKDENISDDQIFSQIESLNKDFRRRNEDAENTPIPFQQFAADSRIVFCLAKVDPKGRHTTGIIRKYTKDQYWLSDDEMKFSSKGGDDAWDASKYLNIWVCNLFGRTLGYGVFPGGPPERDGLVIQYNVFGTRGNLKASFNKGRTVTHETGHWLGLKHLWGDASCGDDGIFDTPQQQTSNTFCPPFPHKSICSPNENGDMFMNFMDFTDDACMNLFTRGQKIAMRSQFAAGHPRNSILQSNVCDSSLATGGPIPEEPGINSTTISIYPNPFTSEIIVQSEDASITGKVLELFDITGKRYISQKITSLKTTILANHLRPGIYLIKITGDKKTEVYKVIK